MAIYLIVAVLGLIIGSFLNVVIYRLPQMALAPEDNFNLAVPRSHCLQCQKNLEWRYLIPVFSFLLLRGKCPYCSQKISCQYPIIESVSMLWALLVFFFWQHNLLDNEYGKAIFSDVGLSYFLMWLCFGYFLLSIALIDAKHQIVPDTLNYSFLWLGLLFNTLHGSWTTLYHAVWGAVFGYLFFWSIYWLYKLWRQREGLGYGDFKLLAALGAWVGIYHLMPIIFLASMSGILWALIGMIRGKHSVGKVFAFAPFLCLAAGIFAVYHFIYW